MFALQSQNRKLGLKKEEVAGDISTLKTIELR